MIRKATIADMAVMLSLGREFYESTQLMQYAVYDNDSAEMTFRIMIESNSAILYLSEKDGEIIGGIGGVMSTCPFNKYLTIAQETFWFVTEKHRGGMEAIRLKKALEEWARENKALAVAMASMKNLNFEQVTRLYRKDGYIELEAHWIRRL